MVNVVANRLPHTFPCGVHISSSLWTILDEVDSVNPSLAYCSSVIFGSFGEVTLHFLPVGICVTFAWHYSDSNGRNTDHGFNLIHINQFPGCSLAHSMC